MSDEIEVIRQQMQETRSALAEKVETLEQQVVETVAGANTAVTETVENVKDAVQETVESVREALDLSRQMDRHPWLFMGGSMALGYLSGWLVQRAARAAERAAYSSPAHVSLGLSTNGQRDDAARERVQPPAAEPPRQEEPGWLSMLGKEFSTEIDKVKSLAIGVGVGLVRDMLAQSAPEPIRPRLSEVMDNLTVKLGGETIRGPLLTPSKEGASHDNRDPAEMGRPMGTVYRQG